MKRLNLFVMLFAALFISAVATFVFAASPLEVTVSTVIPNNSANGSAAYTAAGYPNITSSTVKIRKVFFSNDGAAERVSVWKTCSSSTTATLVWDGIVPSSTTAAVAPGNLEVDWLPNAMNLVAPCVSKGLNGSGTVKAHVIYE